jgi:hypothetical protein
MVQQISFPYDLSGRAYDEQTCQQLCAKLLAHFPASELDHAIFRTRYARHYRWYCKQNVSTDDDLFLYFLFTLQLPASALQTGPAQIYVKYIDWFVENEFDQRNRFHNGFADDFDGEASLNRNFANALLLDCLEYLSLMAEKDASLGEFRSSEQKCLDWYTRVKCSPEQFGLPEKKFAHWATAHGFLETNPLLRYVTFVNWFAAHDGEDVFVRETSC